jgi:CDP-diacylglycerol--serine O-phosphatidyltransferase
MGHGDEKIINCYRDWANLCTGLGLIFGATAIVLLAAGRTNLGAAFMLAAVLCDLLDGTIARASRGRTELESTFGGALDSLSDMLHSGAAPALYIAIHGHFAPWAVLLSIGIVVSGGTRLAYFNSVGLGESGTYTGVPIFFMPVWVVFWTLGLSASTAWEPILVVPIAGMCVAQVSRIQVRKLKGPLLYAFISLVTILIIYLIK